MIHDLWIPWSFLSCLPLFSSLLLWHQLEPAIPLIMGLGEEGVGLLQARGFSFPQFPVNTLKELSGIKVMGWVRNSIHLASQPPIPSGPSGYSFCFHFCLYLEIVVKWRIVISLRRRMVNNGPQVPSSGWTLLSLCTSPAAAFSGSPFSFSKLRLCPSPLWPRYLLLLPPPISFSLLSLSSPFFGPFIW